MSNSIAFCLATYREDTFEAWLREWQPLFSKHDVHLYVAWDSAKYPPVHVPENTTFITRASFPPHVPKGSSACRSVAVKRAYDNGHEFIGFLDDDVLPPADGKDIIQAYIDGFKTPVEGSGYFNVAKEFYGEGYCRGFPYKERHTTPIVAQYGGWDNVPDLDARDTQAYEIKHGGKVRDFMFAREFKVVPKYLGFTGCFMNCMFRREVVPVLYHLYQGIERTGYDRFDDIWASLILKRIVDHFGWSVAINGLATCEHTRLSNTEKSLLQEQAGHAVNEDLWETLTRASLNYRYTVVECYESLILTLPVNQCGKAAQWIGTFKEECKNQ